MEPFEVSNMTIFPELTAEKTFESSFEKVSEFTLPTPADTCQSLVNEEPDLENFVMLHMSSPVIKAFPSEAIAKEIILVE